MKNKPRKIISLQMKLLTTPSPKDLATKKKEEEEETDSPLFE